MNVLSPVPPPYDPLEWEKKPFADKSRMVCRAWALQGYGAPLVTLALYGLKTALYVGMWIFFCSFSPGLEDPRAIASWWLEPIAFQKAILWSMLFEGLGLGCGSGPLTGRYVPPFGGALYFLRPGTTKRAVFPALPVIGGLTRTWLDVALYLAHTGFLVRVLIAPELTASLLVPTAILLPVLGLCDRTVFLAARAEHYYVTVLCFFATGWIAGAKAVQIALWIWAGVSKLNHHFPAVVCIMTSNSPVMRGAWIRKRMYRRYPDDLRPSTLAVAMAHAGTFLELSVPVVLALGEGGAVTRIGLVMMLMLHGFITSNLPMGVPIEWNVMVVYGAVFLFGQHAPMSVFDVGSAPVAVLLLITLVGVPLLGNLFPDKMSFLLAMRYYAGNWAYSVWLFKGDSYRKLDRHLTKASPWVSDQLERFYDRKTAVGLLGRVLAFRAMHLHGRVLQMALPKAVDRLEDYEHVDGEVVAGLALGWNFGDGHLHDEALLANLQAQCGFEEGELRCIFVESQPFLRPSLYWRIADAKTGRIEEGESRIEDLPPASALAHLKTVDPHCAFDDVRSNTFLNRGCAPRVSSPRDSGAGGSSIIIDSFRSFQRRFDAFVGKTGYEELCQRHVAQLADEERLPFEALKWVAYGTDARRASSVRESRPSPRTTSARIGRARSKRRSSAHCASAADGQHCGGVHTNSSIQQASLQIPKPARHMVKPYRA